MLCKSSEIDNIMQTNVECETERGYASMTGLTPNSKLREDHLCEISGTLEDFPNDTLPSLQCRNMCCMPCSVSFRFVFLHVKMRNNSLKLPVLRIETLLVLNLRMSFNFSAHRDSISIYQLFC